MIFINMNIKSHILSKIKRLGINNLVRSAKDLFEKKDSLWNIVDHIYVSLICFALFAYIFNSVYCTLLSGNAFSYPFFITVVKTGTLLRYPVLLYRGGSYSVKTRQYLVGNVCKRRSLSGGRYVCFPICKILLLYK